MNDTESGVGGIFRFWRTVEALTPQKTDKPNPHDQEAPIYAIGAPHGILPWQDPKHLHKPLKQARTWRYMAQCALYDVGQLSSLLEDKVGAHSEVFDEKRGGRSRLFDLAVDEKGRPIPETLTLSLAGWAAGQILHAPGGISALEKGGTVDLSGLPEPTEERPPTNSGYRQFDELSWRLMHWVIAEVEVMTADEGDTDIHWLERLKELIVEKCLFPDSVLSRSPAYIVKCTQIQIRKPKKQDDDRQPEKAVSQPDDMLNSFFIQDLQTLEHAWKHRNTGAGFREYMTAVADSGRRRVDLRSPEGLDASFAALAPERAPQGQWPSAHPLVFSQQLAVNEVWRRLRNASGIFAVNGPPGTGKTTLLRDIVATVVTERAITLLDVGDKILKRKSVHKIGETLIPYYSFPIELGGTAIVAASSNNGAVENLSLELPGLNAVPTDVASGSDYFSQLASDVIEKPAWGLLAARLGNKSNRGEFLNRFWWREPKVLDKTGKLVPAEITPTNEGGEGLRYHLKLLQDGKRSPALSWNVAKASLRDALRHEEAIRKSLEGAASAYAAVAAQQERVNQVRQAILQAEQMLGDLRCSAADAAAHMATISAEASKRRERLTDARNELHSHDTAKPGVLMWLSTFGRSHRDWWDRRQVLIGHADAARKQYAATEPTLIEAKNALATTQNLLAKTERELGHKRADLEKAHAKLQSAEKEADDMRATIGAHWPGRDADDDTREKSSPWTTYEWRKARERTFLAALELHRAFIENNPSEMIANLNLSNDWLQGKDMPENMASTALATLCLVVPVISTTFASMPRMFRLIGSEGIGWLLIDEAGQALPQQAAGAIWRAKRTVVVGDPKQLEPVSAVPAAVEGALARHYDVPMPWWPSCTSTQELADQTMDIGTRLPGAGNEKVWVGCPLRVHRRCDNPMFSVSNQVAYDGLMVHGKDKSDCALPDSCWIDVVRDDSTIGIASEAVGRKGIPALSEKLAELLQVGAKMAGSFQAREVLCYIEEQLTFDETDQATAFLDWVVANGRAYGWNIRAVYSEYAGQPQDDEDGAPRLGH